MTSPVRVLSAGLGNMGRSHALAYHRNPGYQIVGLVNRTSVTAKLLPIKVGTGKNCSWGVKTTGIISENYSEGADAANFGSNAQIAATLNWGSYRGNAHVSGLARRAALDHRQPRPKAAAAAVRGASASATSTDTDTWPEASSRAVATTAAGMTTLMVHCAVVVPSGVSMVPDSPAAQA